MLELAARSWLSVVMSAPASSTAAKSSCRSSRSTGDVGNAQRLDAPPEIKKIVQWAPRRTLEEFDQSFAGQQTAETRQRMLADDEFDVGVQGERRSFIDDDELAAHAVAEDVARGHRHLASGLADGDDVDVDVAPRSTRATASSISA